MRYLPVSIVATCAFLGPYNPVDTVARGKFVRHFQTGKGEASATVCIPAETPEAVPRYYPDLPRIMRALEVAGAAAIAVDLDPRPDPALIESPLLVRDGQTTPVHQGGVVIGLAAQPMPLAVSALAAHRIATEGPAIISNDGFPASDMHIFMPYEIPFLHWDKTDTWTNVIGRTVFIGACKADRELTRFGRQPGTVAHGELFETLRDRVFVTRIPVVYEVLVALVTFVLADAGRRVYGRGVALAVAAAVLVTALTLSLNGVWIALTGVVAAGLVAALHSQA